MLLCTLLVSVSSIAAGEPELPDRHPFAPLAAIPRTVDAAAVFDNPAENLLLSDAGRKVRSLLATSGVLTQSEQAWAALARAFDQDTDRTIRDLLGKRVAVVWDGLDDQARTPASLATMFDSRWALMCEVDEDYLGRIRQHLRPVKRTITQGQPVYAIEQGRYALVLLDSTPARPATVLLAPREGSALLSRMIELVSDRNHALETRTILSGKRELLASLPQHAPGSTPSVAWLVRAETMHAIARFSKPASSTHQPPRHTGGMIAGLTSIEDRGVRTEFVTDIHPPEPGAPAPAELLDAVADDAVFALATARSPMRLIAPGLLEPWTSTPDEPDRSDDIFQAPGLLMLSPPNHDPGELTARCPAMIMTVLVRHTGIDEHASSLASRADEAIARRLAAAEPENTPHYAGRFPDAVRTHRMRSAIPHNEDTNHTPWSASSPVLAWKSQTIGDEGFVVAAFAPAQSDSPAHVRRISRATARFAALPRHTDARHRVLASGFFRPARAVSIFQDLSPVDLALSRAITKITFDLRTDPLGARGSLLVELAAPDAPASLGNR